MNRGDIYMVSLDPAPGDNKPRRRPVLVISPAAFNEVMKVPVILPISRGGEYARSVGFVVPLSGTLTTGVIRCSQPRILDVFARGGKKVESVSKEILEDVLARIATLFQ